MTTEQVIGFDAPKHGGTRKGFPEGLKDGVQEHRILPSFDGTGQYIRNHTCHYGYSIKMQNSDKEIPNPFYCVEEGKFIGGKFLVTQECPECREIKRIKAEKEAVEVDMKRLGKSESEIAVATSSHQKWLMKHNRDFKFYLNVKGSDGRFFTVKYPSKNVWKVIDALIQKYKTQKVPIDAIAASQGLWFRITRSGKGFNTAYSAEVVMEDIFVNGQTYENAKPKMGPLTAEDAAKAKEYCLDLRDVGIRRLSVEQVQRLVDSKGDPSVAQAVFAGSDYLANDTTTRGDVEASPEPLPTLPTAPVAAPVEPLVVPVAPVVQAPVAVSVPLTAAPSNLSQSELLAQAKALMMQARDMGPTPVAVAPAAPAPASPVPPITPPLPIAPPPVAPPVPVSAASIEADFLTQFANF